MTTYADSSALIALYVPEAYSVEARRQIAAVPQVPFTPLHDLEVRNAFEALRGRRLITPKQFRAVKAHLEADLLEHRLCWTPLELAGVFADARILAERHTARVLCRSLDVLHVAAAKVIGCRRLISGDDRQLKLARAMRLTAIDIKQPAGSAQRRREPPIS